MRQEVEKELIKLVDKVANESLEPESFAGICESIGVVRLYYDIEFDKDGFRGVGDESDISKYRYIELFNSGEESDIKKVYTYYYDGNEYVHACIEFKKGMTEEDIDKDTCSFIANVIYLIVSRHNMRNMLDYAENFDKND